MLPVLLNKYHKYGFMALTTFCVTVLSTAPSFAKSCSKFAGYTISQDKVTYRQSGLRKRDFLEVNLRNVDLASFRALTTKIRHWTSCVNPYGVDKNHVYYEGKILKGVKGSSFKKPTNSQENYTDGHVIVVFGKIIGKFGDKKENIGGGYFRLGKNYFFHEVQLPEPILKLVGRQYAIGRNAVYFQGRPTKFDPKTLESKGSYLRDRHGVYCQRTRQLLDADPKTFTVHFQKPALAADQQHFFFECKKVQQATGSYLDLFDHGFLRDDRHVYFMNKPILGLDAASLVVHFQGGKYIQDKNGVYYITKKNFSNATIQYRKIKGADLNTFQATGYSKARDMMSLFKKNQRIGDNWDGLKNNKSSFFRVQRKRLYKLKIPSPFANNFE